MADFLGEGSEDEFWPCAQCTFRNHKLLPFCEMCGSGKPAAGSKAPQVNARHSENSSSSDFDVLDDVVIHSDENPLRRSPRSTRSVQAPRALSPRRRSHNGRNLNENLLEQTLDNSFFCAVCQEMSSLSELAYGLSCAHTFCRDCLSGYITYEILNGRVLKMHCPGVTGTSNNVCSQQLSVPLMQELVDAEIMDKYQRFVQMRSNPSFRQCPFCGHGQVANPKSPKVTCEKCQQVYCFFHANAHQGTSCRVFNKRTRKEFKRDRGFLMDTSVKCPSCSAPITKSSGCNHMTCTVCAAEFCYLCQGRNFDGFHYASYNRLLGCADQQMAQGGPRHRATCVRRGVRLCAWMLSSTLALLMFVIVVALGVVLFVLFVLIKLFICFPVWLPEVLSKDKSCCQVFMPFESVDWNDIFDDIIWGCAYVIVVFVSIIFCPVMLVILILLLVLHIVSVVAFSPFWVLCLPCRALRKAICDWISSPFLQFIEQGYFTDWVVWPVEQVFHLILFISQVTVLFAFLVVYFVLMCALAPFTCIACAVAGSSGRDCITNALLIPVQSCAQLILFNWDVYDDD